MRFWISLVCAATLAAGLAGCGDGGGGGGGGGLPVAALTITVSVNGSAATADANGQFAVKPGDTVEITSSQGADWTTSGSNATAISLRNPNVSGIKWAAQILNATTGAVTYTVSAKASANPSLTKATVLNISAGDARNRTYRVYAASALQYQSTLDFNANVYTFVNLDGSAPVTDTFNTDSSEPGTFFFKTSRVTSVANMSRFRMATDAVVGAFPFVDPVATGTVYAVKPFIGARNLVTSQAQLDGTYNRLGIQRTAASEASQIAQMESRPAARSQALHRLHHLQRRELPAGFGVDLHGHRVRDSGRLANRQHRQSRRHRALRHGPHRGPERLPVRGRVALDARHVSSGGSACRTRPLGGRRRGTAVRPRELGHHRHDGDGQHTQRDQSRRDDGRGRESFLGMGAQGPAGRDAPVPGRHGLHLLRRL